MKDLKFYGLSAFGFLALLVSVFLLLRNEGIFNNTLGQVATPYQNVDGQIGNGTGPYSQITEESLTHWDVWHYKLIREAGYDVKTAGGEYIFAFFPLFPLVWKLSLLPITWLPLLNYVLFVTSLFLLFQSHSWNRMSSAHNRILFLIALTLPTIASFLMPYTEAVFAVTLAVALIGMMKGKYRMYFTGALLAAATRPSGTLIIGALFVLDLIRNHKLPLTILLREYLKKALPFALGTLLVGIYQHMVGSGSIFTFMDV